MHSLPACLLVESSQGRLGYPLQATKQLPAPTLLCPHPSQPWFERPLGAMQTLANLILGLGSKCWLRNHLAHLTVMSQKTLPRKSEQ